MFERVRLGLAWWRWERGIYKECRAEKAGKGEAASSGAGGFDDGRERKGELELNYETCPICSQAFFQSPMRSSRMTDFKNALFKDT